MKISTNNFLNLEGESALLTDWRTHVRRDAKSLNLPQYLLK